ncbi:MAG: ABC transporter permease [Leifsonia sp.]|nr:ABC transporter permease [Leifsonia sp.]|tara:strand:+ start:29274 stop:30494 length:1221 start_codon:yes stop_codon:yes gene_type:complete
MTTEQTPGAPAETNRWRRALTEITTGNALLSLLAILLAVLIGGILIAITDPDVQEAAGYFFSRPADTFGAIWQSISGAYVALFQGAIYDARRDDLLLAIRPITQTLVFATPLIAAGLGVAIAFRVGLFNIGGRGQIIIGAAFAGYASFAFDLPVGVHLVVAVLLGIIGGALWGGIAGFLKARTGAHEVIVTIMLNYVAFYLVSYLLRTPVLQNPASNNPKSPPAAETAVLPAIFGSPFNLHWGFVLVVASTVLAWWLLERSSLGFKFRAVGFNPDAARTAGIKVERMYLYVMLIAGGYAGLAASTEVLGTVTSGFTSAVDAGIGFDAITVALLGRSRPWGVFAAGILFGAFKTGGFTMQASQGVPIDIVLVVQSLIVLFIAAPPLVRAIFRIPGAKTGAESKAVAA